MSPGVRHELLNSGRAGLRVQEFRVDRQAEETGPNFRGSGLGAQELTVDPSTKSHRRRAFPGIEAPGSSGVQV